MIKAIAVDDELPALKIIQHFCGKIDFIHLEAVFNKPTEALAYAAQHAVDLLFLDINMPSLTGLSLSRQLTKSTLVIFTTAYSEYALEGFNADAVDYLLKPFSFDRFLKAVNKAAELYNLRKSSNAGNGFLLIKADYSIIKINIDDIHFVEGLDDYLKIHLAEQKPVVARMTMKALFQKLPQHLFARVHRSYIVSLKNVESLRNKIITVKGREIPLSNSYEQEFLKWFGSR